jgi:hypothetical protein
MQCEISMHRVDHDHARLVTAVNTRVSTAWGMPCLAAFETDCP